MTVFQRHFSSIELSNLLRFFCFHLIQCHQVAIEQDFLSTNGNDFTSDDLNPIIVYVNNPCIKK